MNPITIILDLCSPVIRDSINSFLKKLKSDAAKTDNPFDDVVVQILFSLLGFSYTE